MADPLSRNPCQLVLLAAFLGAKRRSLTEGSAVPDSVVVTPCETESVSGVESEGQLLLREAFRQGYATDPWFRDHKNTRVLMFDEAEGLWFMEHRVVVPAGELRRQILQESHDAPYSGHMGRAKTSQLVSRNYWWPSLRADVEGCNGMSFFQQYPDDIIYTRCWIAS